MNTGFGAEENAIKVTEHFDNDLFADTKNSETTTPNQTEEATLETEEVDNFHGEEQKKVKVAPPKIRYIKFITSDFAMQNIII